MEELTFGTVVQSVCGRDRYRVFLVVEIDNSDPVRPASVVIADGSLRKLAGRKHKNPSHLKFVARPTEEELSRLREGPDDEQILTICKKYDFKKNNLKGT